MSYRIAYNTKK